MTRSLIYAAAVASAVLVYLLTGIVTQLLGGTLQAGEVAGALGVSLIGCTVLTLVAFAVINYGRKALGFVKPGPQPRPITKPIALVIGVALVVGAGLGISVSMDRIHEHRALLARAQMESEARRAAQGAEQKRVAALTPEQRTAEAAERERKVKETAQAAQAEKDKAEARRVADETAKQERATARAMAAAGTKQLRDSMKNPESFVLKSALLMSDGSVCYDYRATNSFNATLRGSAVLLRDGQKVQFLVQENDGNHFVSAWNKRCANKSGEELSELIMRVIE